MQKEKNKTPIIPYEERSAIIAALKYVDEVVPQEDKNKLGAWEKYHFDKMFVGSDWKGTPKMALTNLRKHLGGVPHDYYHTPPTGKSLIGKMALAMLQTYFLKNGLGEKSGSF